MKVLKSVVFKAFLLFLRVERSVYMMMVRPAMLVKM